MTPLRRTAEALGVPLSRVAAVAVAAGIVAFVAGIASGRAAAALAALDASWLFFAGLAAGSVALVAAIRIAHGRWAGPILPLAEAGAGFFLPALALLVVLVLGVRALVPGTGGAGAARVAVVAVRLLVPSAVLFGLGARFVARAARAGADAERARPLAVAYVVMFAIALSFWAFDLVMELTQGPPATVIPAYYFLGAFLSGLSWVALLAALRDVSGPDLRHDLGKLLFAFIVVWTYLLWALFLPTWYGNIPEESALLLRRWTAGWRPVSIAVLVAVFFWPFWLLFSERLKRRRTTLAVGAATVLAGLLAERFLLVLPSIRLAPDAGTSLVVAGVTAGVAGAFLLAVGARLPARGARTIPEP
jgi:hypothetical protein